VIFILIHLYISTIKLIEIYDFSYPSIAVFQENQFSIEILSGQGAEAMTEDNYKLFFAKSIAEHLFQVSIFDEFVPKLNYLKVKLDRFLVFN
jgi:hypothetical protein